MKLEMEELWEMVCGKESKSKPIIEEITSTITNQVAIFTLKKKYHTAPGAIYDCIDNSIFVFVGVCKTSNEARLASNITFCYLAFLEENPTYTIS